MIYGIDEAGAYIKIQSRIFACLASLEFIFFQLMTYNLLLCLHGSNFMFYILYFMYAKIVQRILAMPIYLFTIHFSLFRRKTSLHALSHVPELLSSYSRYALSQRRSKCGSCLANTHVYFPGDASGAAWLSASLAFFCKNLHLSPRLVLLFKLQNILKLSKFSSRK